MNDATDEIPLPSLPVLSEEESARQIRADQMRYIARDELDWLFANCRIVYYGPAPDYPIEHAPGAHKNHREDIERIMRTAIDTNRGKA